MAIDPKTGDIGVDDERYVLDTVTTRIDWLSLECWGCAFSRRYFQGAIFNALGSVQRYSTRTQCTALDPLL